jgi:transcriptional regulator with XRE-family HTH domain
MNEKSQESVAQQPGSGVARVVRMEDLGELIRAKRRNENLTLEQAARQSGVSAATLSRWERQWGRERATSGESTPEPDTRTLAAIARWLGVSMERIMAIEPPQPIESVVHREGDDTPAMVEAHLRADPNLDAATAAALARVFRVAYEQFAQPQASPHGNSTGGVDAPHGSQGRTS